MQDLLGSLWDEEALVIGKEELREELPSMDEALREQQLRLSLALGSSNSEFSGSNGLDPWP